MDQVIQIAGALLILGAFVANQRRALASDTVLYLVLNTVGSAVLAVLAFLDEDWGFLLLEGVWLLVSLYGLGAALRRQAAGSSTGAATGVEKV